MLMQDKKLKVGASGALRKGKELRNEAQGQGD
jgi:hypothetical protein